VAEQRRVRCLEESVRESFLAWLETHSKASVATRTSYLGLVESLLRKGGEGRRLSIVEVRVLVLSCVSSPSLIIIIIITIIVVVIYQLDRAATEYPPAT
jgi:hypothetical protein